MQDYKDRSGLQFINFDLVTGGQEIKVSFLFVIFYLFFFQHSANNMVQSFDSDRILSFLVVILSFY